MKKIFFSLFILCLTTGAFAQSETTQSPAQVSTGKLAKEYGLNQNQQAEMLKVQERKYRNLAEIEPLKNSNPQLYIQKVRSLQYANDMSFRKVLDEQQEKTFQQKQSDLRRKKAEIYKEMKSTGAAQNLIDAKIAELDVEALQ